MLSNPLRDMSNVTSVFTLVMILEGLLCTLLCSGKQIENDIVEVNFYKHLECWKGSNDVLQLNKMKDF